jgi:spore maturation protein SpmA
MAKWAGIFKVMEETGELQIMLGKLQQTIGKLGAFPEGNHPVQGPMLLELVEEMVDVEAAIHYFYISNPQLHDLVNTHVRRGDKIAKFLKWGLSGVNDGKL